MPRNSRRKIVGKFECIARDAQADELRVLARTMQQEWQARIAPVAASAATQDGVATIATRERQGT